VTSSPPARAGTELAEAAAWATWQASPWGRLRYRVVAATLRRWLADVSDGPLRVLDAGGGDGRDAVQLAVQGHDVTVLDTAPDLLDLARTAARAAGVGDRLHTVAADLEDLHALAALTRHRAGGSGSFDVVLCHDVLQHRGSRAQVRADVATLASSLRPGGLLSLLAPNPAADVLTAAVRGDPAEAWVLLDAATARDGVTGRTVLRLEPDEVLDALRAAGCEPAGRAGVLSVTGLLEDLASADERLVDDLEHLEVALSDREPHLRSARSWHLAARRR
jgi:S-adenosylmethionine-dependent methyltransferase